MHSKFTKTLYLYHLETSQSFQEYTSYWNFISTPPPPQIEGNGGGEGSTVHVKIGSDYNN
jgi:hypothetical protein